MRAGGSLSLFIESKVHDKEQIEMNIDYCLFSMVKGTSIYFVPGHTKYVIVEHRFRLYWRGNRAQTRRNKRCIQLDTRS